MLTLYYVSATFLQSWRIKNVCTKIAEQLAQQSSIAFYTLPATAGDAGYNAVIATSELCNNRSSAKITELLWLHGTQRGCCIQPVQNLHLVPWLSFPEVTTSLIPFAYDESTHPVYQSPSHKKKLLHLLLETETMPNYDNGYDANIVRVEEYAINPEGKPQPFHMVSNHLRKSTRNKSERLTNEEWKKHLGDLRSLSVLASQAAEFEYNKNRTEGKTGVVKPDLIPSEKKIPSITETIKKNVEKIVVTEEKLDEIKSNIKVNDGKLLKEIKKEENKNEKKLDDINLTTHTTTDIITELKDKPTENMKFIKNESRFTTTIVPESPSKSIFTLPPKIASETKPSELEKLAAATVAKRERSPSPKATSTPVKTSNTIDIKTSKEQKETITPEKTILPTITIVSEKPIIPTINLTPVKSIQSIIKSEEPIEEKKSIPEIIEIIKPDLNGLPKTDAIVVNIEVTEKPSSINNNQKPEVINSTTAIKSSNEDNIISVNKDHTKRPILRRNKDSLGECKPLNILVYSDSPTTRESTLLTLQNILEKDMYTIYPLVQQQVEERHWLENTALLVVCGTITGNIGEIFVDYFLRGGKVMSLCSDFLHFILPTYRTAEVREHELVQFSYDKWQKVRMMHHIFCYQPSPVKKNFSTDSEDSTNATTRKPALLCPRSIELKDLNGEQHNLNVQVLGTEETWNTPSLLLANNIKSGGRVLFSQVHLETSPMQFEMDETKFPVLKQNENIRLEILADLLAKYLNVNVRKNIETQYDVKFKSYPNAYFLGRFESKSELLEKLKGDDGASIINTENLTLKFFTDDDKTINIINKNLLPVHIHLCPDDFSTVEYFDNLKTKDIGRLVIYAPLINSSMYVINDTNLLHGVAVLPKQQTNGIGRSYNQWLSPLGCAMFSIQLHISMDKYLGKRLPLIQHIVGAAIVNSFRSHELYNVLDIALKWPNDIYANGIVKIGGLIVKTFFNEGNSIVNIGSAINLDNTKPTTCINDMIKKYNNGNNKNLPLLSYEKCIALIFNEIERLIDDVQNDKFDDFYKLYYNLWLHDDQTINICDKDGITKEAQIVGIDDFGYLKVKLATDKIETVQPDGNSFDMLRGLIVPKYH